MAQPEKLGKLITELAHTSWDQRAMARGRVLELVVSSIFIALVGLYVARQVIDHWPGSDWWGILSGGCRGAALVGGFLLSLAAFRRDWAEAQQMKAAALALRAAAEEGDEQLAPLAAEQPLPLSPAELAAGPERFALFGSWKNNASVSVGIGVVLLVAGAGLCTALLLLIVSDNQPGGGLALAAEIVGGLLLFFAALGGMSGGGLLIVLSCGQRRSTYLEADERGVRFWGSGWQHLRSSFLPWGAVRSFFVIAYREPRKAHWRKVYVLDTHESLLLWHVSGQSGKERLAMFERFHQVVVTRARLPLRDLSAAAAQVARVAASDESARPAGNF